MSENDPKEIPDTNSPDESEESIPESRSPKSAPKLRTGSENNNQDDFDAAADYSYNALTEWSKAHPTLALLVRIVVIGVIGLIAWVVISRRL